MADYELLLHDQFGVRLKEIKPVSFSVARRVNEVGATSIVIPHGTGIEYGHIQRDQIVTISRALPGAKSYLEGETLWFMTGREWSREALQIYLQDANTILQRRIIAYYAQSAQASKSGPAANVIRAIIRENFGNLAPAGRDVSAFLAIQADDGLGATVSKDFAWRPVLDTIKEIAAASEEAGVFCGFDVVAAHSPMSAVSGRLAFNLEFRCFRQQRGLDHRWPGGNPPVLIGSKLGTLNNPKVSETWTGELSKVYAGGEGQGVNRLIDSATKQTRVDASIFGLIEGFRDANRVKTSAGLQDEASTQLAARTARTIVTGSLAETEKIRYGREIRFGDFLTVSEPDAGANVDVRLNAVQIDVKREGETIAAALEGSY